MGFSDNLTEMATDLAQSVAATSKRLAEAGVAKPHYYILQHLVSSSTVFSYRNGFAR